jgi:hypothetical protein
MKAKEKQVLRSRYAPLRVACGSLQAAYSGIRVTRSQDPHTALVWAEGHGKLQFSDVKSIKRFLATYVQLKFDYDQYEGQLKLSV